MKKQILFRTFQMSAYSSFRLRNVTFFAKVQELSVISLNKMREFVG